MTLKTRNILPAVAVALAALIALPGCFTGVEKTAVIKDTTAKNSPKVKASAEQQLMNGVVEEAPAAWTAGKQFMVTEGRLDYAFTPISAASKLAAGDTLTFMEFRPGVRLSGDSITEVVLQTPHSGEIAYKIESPKSQILKEEALSVPFTIELDLVKNAQAVLKGQKVWTLKPGSHGRKFQAGEISQVLPGNSDYPFRVVVGSDTLFMVTNSHSSATSRTFANLFTLSDPRKLHPEISDKNWELISQGRVAADMTREECRLAIGAPAEIERNALPGGLYERWTYENGVSLIFTDGLLTNFRQ